MIAKNPNGYNHLGYYHWNWDYYQTLVQSKGVSITNFAILSLGLKLTKTAILHEVSWNFSWLLSSLLEGEASRIGVVV